LFIFSFLSQFIETDNHLEQENVVDEKNHIENANSEELDSLEVVKVFFTIETEFLIFFIHDFKDDFADDRILQNIRQKRIEELKKLQCTNRFGDVRDISKLEWISEVTESSKSCWVVVHLYQDSVIDCRVLNEIIINLAAKFRNIKFLRIQSNQAVENWPNRNLPTLFIYHEGVLKHQMMTLQPLKHKSPDGIINNYSI